MDPILLFLGFLGFVIISAISNILEKKQQREREREARRTGQPVPPPRQREESATWPPPDWQDQLRRMLNPGEESAPPVIQQPPPRREHRPPPPARAEGPSGRDARSLAEPVREHRRHASTLLRRTTGSVHDKAAALHDKVAARVEAIEQQKTDIQKDIKTDIPSRPGLTLRRKTPPPPPAQVRKAIQMVRDPYMVREAFVCSVILGPPKALEESR